MKRVLITQERPDGHSCQLPIVSTTTGLWSCPAEGCGWSFHHIPEVGRWFRVVS